MQNGRIRSTQLIASSSYDSNSGPNRGRLYLRRAGSRWGAWIAKYNTRTQWLQVNFGGYKRLVKFATQGREDARQWVTQYTLAYSQNGMNWADYKENSAKKVLHDVFFRSWLYFPVVNITAKYVRFRLKKIKKKTKGRYLA